MTSPPTLAECNEWVCEHSAALMSNVASRQDVAMLLDSLQILVEALDAPLAVLEPLKGRVRQLKKRLANQQDQTQLKDVLRHIQELGQECQTIVDKPTSFVKKDPSPNYYIEPNRILPSRTRAQQYAHPWPDQIDTKAYWFRQYFVGKPYVTLIGPLSPSSVPKEEQEHAIISIVREHEKEFAKKDSVSFVGNRYRVIVRGKETFLSRQVVHETVAKAVQVRLEAVGMADCLDCKAPKPKRSRPLRTFSSALSNGPQPNSMTRTMRAALLAIYPDVDLRCFHELSAEETILAGLEKEFLRFDEIGIPRNYKFGVLTIRKDQKTEEEWFNNSGMSDDLREFLETLGTCVQLKGYKGYAAGLDPKTGESGDISYMTTWEDHDIMFHVAPLMPARDNDRQQVHRKRYIGNDIVCLVFIEGDSSEFHFNAIRSQFLHVYILVHAETVAGQRAWRIEVVRHKNVPEFGPHIPSPPLFYNKEELKRFLTVKLVNAENAALKSDKFRIPNTKARSSMFRTLMQTGLEASQTAQSFRSSRLASDGNLVVKSNFYQTERPKSAGAQRSRSSLRNLRAAHEGSVRCATPDMGPMPVSSRSSILRDLKSLAKHRISHGPSLTRPSPPADDNSSQGSTSSDEKDRGSSKLNGCKKDKSTCKSKPETHSIRSRAQSLMSSVMGRRSQSNHAVSSAASSLRPSTNIPRSRTFMNGQRHDFKEDDSLHPCS